MVKVRIVNIIMKWALRKKVMVETVDMVVIVVVVRSG